MGVSCIGVLGSGNGEEDAKRFRRDVLTSGRAEVGPLTEPDTEQLEFAIDPSEYVFILLKLFLFGLDYCKFVSRTSKSPYVFLRKTRLQGDLIILGGSPTRKSSGFIATLRIPSRDSPSTPRILASSIALHSPLSTRGLTRGLPVLHLITPPSSRENRETEHRQTRSRQNARRAIALPTGPESEQGELL